jgi:hypothetical protein
MLFFLLNSLNKIHAFYQYRCGTCGATTVLSPVALVPLATAIFVGAQQLWCYDLMLLNT